MTSVEIGDIWISDVTTLKAFRTLLQYCPAASTYLGDEIVVDLRSVAMLREFKYLLLIFPEREESLYIILNSKYGDGDSMQCILCHEGGQEGHLGICWRYSIGP